MKTNRLISILLLIVVLLLPGCGSAEDPEGAILSDAGSAGTETALPAPEPYAFKAHLYSPLLSRYYSQEWWDSLYHLCDALREGRDTFACASQEIYDWCMDEVTLAHMFPAASMAVSGKSNDGTVPFENGVGRIYYNIPPEEFVVRQAEFETLVEELLNSVLEPDDTEFEKSLKLYAYMAANFTYGDITIDGEGFTYTALSPTKSISMLSARPTINMPLSVPSATSLIMDN